MTSIMRQPGAFAPVANRAPDTAVACIVWSFQGCVNRRALSLALIRRHCYGCAGMADAPITPTALIAVIRAVRNSASPDRYNSATARTGFAFSEMIPSLATRRARDARATARCSAESCRVTTRFTLNRR
jgi:hypothetical protein